MLQNIQRPSGLNLFTFNVHIHGITVSRKNEKDKKRKEPYSSSGLRNNMFHYYIGISFSPISQKKFAKSTDAKSPTFHTINGQDWRKFPRRNFREYSVSLFQSHLSLPLSGQQTHVITDPRCSTRA